MKKRKRKNIIIVSALKMFTKEGFYNTTIAQVAKNINMSAGNIYNYFPSKNSLAKSSITFVTKKLAIILRNINNKDITPNEKIYLFVVSYLNFLQKNPEMIDYFFRVYLANREIFCDEEDCGFKFVKDFIDEIEQLIYNGIRLKVFRKQDFFISFSCVAGILGGITFLNGEKVLDKNLDTYAKDLSNAICKALS